LYDGVGPARLLAVFCAEKAASPPTGILRKNLDTVTAETLLDPFAVQQFGLNRTGV
jgi:hypothetical protein